MFKKGILAVAFILLATMAYAVPPVMITNPDGSKIANVTDGKLDVNATDSVVSATFIKKTIDFSASETAQAIWTPASGKKFVITDIVIATSAGGTITIFDNTNDTTNRIIKVYLSANSGVTNNYRKPVVSSTADNVLKYTTGTGIAGSLTISGYEI